MSSPFFTSPPYICCRSHLIKSEHGHAREKVAAPAVYKRPAKSLMRMLGPTGNPQARNLFEVIGHLQRAEGLHFELSLKAAS